MGKEAEGTGVQALFDKINEVVHQGNVRRIVVTDRRDRKILDIPVNAGVIAAVVAPMFTMASTALALVGGWHITVERTDPDVVDGESANTGETTEPGETGKADENGKAGT